MMERELKIGFRNKVGESLKLFQEGTQLVEHCGKLLDEAELQVKMILTDESLMETLKAAGDAKVNTVYYTLGENNRNTIAIILGIGSLCMLHLGFSRNKLWFVFMVITVLLGLITGSRKMILTILVGTVLYLFLQNKYVRKRSGDKKGGFIIFKT